MIKPNPTHTEGNNEVNFSVGFSVDSFITENSNNKLDTKFGARPYVSYHYWQ